MYLAHALGVKFSFTGHAADLFVDRQMLASKVGAAAFVACISHWHRDFYHSLETGQDQFPIIRCGVDVSQFKPSVDRAQSSVLKIAAVGRLVVKKGFDTLIEALALRVVSPEGAKYPVSVDVIGGGPEEIRLREAARQSGVDEAVAFRGEQPNGIVRDLLAESDLFVLPCRTADDGDRDGIPVALMEAMASGVCVISGRLPAIEELVKHEACGVLVPPGEASALAQAISRLAGDDALRQRLAGAGRKRVEEEFSSPVNLERLEDSLRRALEPGGGS